MSAMKMKLNVFLVAFFAAVLIGEAANFQLPQPLPGVMSRLIKEVVEKKFIKPFDIEASRKFMRYIPIWA